MPDWTRGVTCRVTGIHLTASPVRAAIGAPGGILEVADGRHVGVGYQILLGGRIVHEGALTLHGPAADGRALPSDLVLAVETLWRHAAEQVAEHEELPPA